MRPSRTAPRDRPNHEGRETGGATTVEVLIRDANRILEYCGVTLSPSKVSRLARDYKRRVEPNGFSFARFLLNAVEMTAAQRAEAERHPDVIRVIAYADPTGEAAARNVDKEGARHAS